MSLAGNSAAAGLGVVQPQAEVHPALGRRLHYGERAAGSDEADDGAAGLHGHRAERGQRGQYRVQDGPQAGAVAVLGGDQAVRLAGQEASEGSAAAFHFGLEPGPARKAVVASYGELGGR